MSDERAERASRRKALGQTKGQSVSFIARGAKVELVHGSIKKLRVGYGDLLVVRLGHSSNDEDTRKGVLKCVSKILRDTGRRAVSVVMPSDFDFEVIPYETAVELLTEITKKKARDDGDDS